MSNRDESIKNFCREIVDYLASARQNSPEITEDAFQHASPEVLNLIKKTQIKVASIIHELVESGENKERLLNLYVIDTTLYQLHHRINKTENTVAATLCLKIKSTANQHLKSIYKKREEAENRFQRTIKWNNRIRILCYLVAIVCMFAGFAYPEYVGIYLSITLICLTQIFILGDLWRNGAKNKRDKVYLKNDPDPTKSALQFLSPDHLIFLLDPPSFSPEYHERYFIMLIELAKSYGWTAKKQIDIEDLIENGKLALEDAYSTLLTKFDPEFINQWRKDFEKIQTELHHLFGDSLYSFNQKINKNPFYYLKKFSSLLSSDLGRHLIQFLKKTELIQ